MPMAYAVEPEAAELSKSPTAADKAPPTEGLHHADNGIVLPNGITIYASLDPAQIQRLTDVLLAYNVWGPESGVVDIPEDQWMTILLVDGWESQLPKSKVYPLGPKDREVVD